MPVLNKQNISICYETFGHTSDPCVIFVAGIISQLVNWPAELTQGLADTGFYVIVFDNRDVGLSTYYDDLEAPDLADSLQKKAKRNGNHPALYAWRYGR